MKKLTFEKYGLSPEKVEQLRAYKILPDKQTLKNIIKGYYNLSDQFPKFVFHYFSC